MISVCMATFNGEKYIKEQIASILQQLSSEDELIVSDDGSSDNTCNIIQKYNDNRITLLYNKGCHGYVGNFENALMHSSGDYIFLCDQDDVWKSNKVHTVMEYLKRYDLVIHNADIVNEKGIPVGKTYYDCTHGKTGFWANLISTRYLGCCMAFRKNVLNKSLPFVSQKRGHDYWIGCVAALWYKVIFIDDILISYRRHGNNASSSSSKSSNSLKKKILKRIDMLHALFLRFVLKK